MRQKLRNMHTKGLAKVTQSNFLTAEFHWHSILQLLGADPTEYTVVVLSDSRKQGACHGHSGTQIVIENLGNQHFQPFLLSVPMKRPGSKLSSVNKKNERSALPSFYEDDLNLGSNLSLLLWCWCCCLGEPSRHYYDEDPVDNMVLRGGWGVRNNNGVIVIESRILKTR